MVYFTLKLVTGIYIIMYYCLSVAKLLYANLRTVYHQNPVIHSYTIYHTKRVCCEGYLENDEEQCFRTFFSHEHIYCI